MSKVAAIDVGSNAIRLILAELKKGKIKTIKKYRIPIRLGADVFEKGKISGKNLKTSARTFRKFNQILRKEKVTSVRAVGTEALRVAKNNQSFIELIRRKSTIRIELIDGLEEARLIHLAVKKTIPIQNKRCLLLDIGGGSVELTCSDNGQPNSAHSFPFGTLRTLDLMKKKKLNETQLRTVIGEYLSPINHFLQANSEFQNFELVVGTGGNMEAIGKLKFQLLKKRGIRILSVNELNEIIETLSHLTIKDRVEKLGMKADRADVIIPAALIAQSVMRLSGCTKLVIPYVGLKDGVLWGLG